MVKYLKKWRAKHPGYSRKYYLGLKRKVDIDDKTD